MLDKYLESKKKNYFFSTFFRFIPGFEPSPSSQHGITQVIHPLFRKYPLIFALQDSEVLLLNTAIEYAALWMKSPKHMKLLQRSLDIVLLVRSNLLRHGVYICCVYLLHNEAILSCCLLLFSTGICRTIWSMFLAPIFHDLAVILF